MITRVQIKNGSSFRAYTRGHVCNFCVKNAILAFHGWGDLLHMEDAKLFSVSLSSLVLEPSRDASMGLG